MRILVLGGSRFLTHELARLALEAGHDVTCAARGESGAVPDGTRFVAIDRSTADGLEQLAGTRFDAVVDPATRPSWVRAALEMLHESTGHWTSISSCSVYRDEQTPGQAMGAPVKASASEDADETDMEIYGELKMASGAAVRSAFPDASLICRPGLIVGPGDRSGRFTYWVERLADAGPVLAPGSPDDVVQVIDVRDLAAWLLASIEAGRVGTYDAISQPMTRRDFWRRSPRESARTRRLSGSTRTSWSSMGSSPGWVRARSRRGCRSRPTRASCRAT